MKKLFIFFFALLLFSFVNVNAQRWPFGAANSITVSTANDTIIITDELTRGINYIAFENDTATVVQATNLSSELKIGDLVYFEISNIGIDNETVTWSTGFTGAASAGTVNKTNIVGFIYNGSALKKFLQTQVN